MNGDFTLNSELYRRAYKTWGLRAQMLMVIEEMAELTQAISKGDRKGILTVKDNLVEEMVDVEIMIEQMKVIMGDHIHEYPPLYKNYREKKLNRLAERLGVQLSREKDTQGVE